MKEFCICEEHKAELAKADTNYLIEQLAFQNKLIAIITKLINRETNKHPQTSSLFYETEKVNHELTLKELQLARDNAQAIFNSLDEEVQSRIDNSPEQNTHNKQ